MPLDRCRLNSLSASQPFFYSRTVFSWIKMKPFRPRLASEGQIGNGPSKLCPLALQFG